MEVRAGLTVLMVLATLLLASGASAGQGKVQAVPPSQGKLAAQPAWVDINSASVAQLKTLPGIGDAEAVRIVAGRPYGDTADLASHKIIPTGVYIAIRHRIIAIQKAPTKKK